MKPFAFFVGCDRSGTTLVRAMFDSHPLLAIPGESHFIPRLIDGRRSYLPGGIFSLSTFLDDLTRDQRFRSWGLGEAQIRAEMSDLPGDISEAIRRLYRCYARSNGKSMYADKTPGYVFKIPLLARWFPESRFVHIVRDGRDVALSLVEVEWGPNSIDEAADYWGRRMQAARQAEEIIPSGRFATLRYEDLIADPEPTLRRICVFIGLRFDPQMLSYPERADQIVASTLSPQSHSGIRLPPTGNLRDWRNELPRRDADSFLRIAGRWLAAHGYAS